MLSYLKNFIMFIKARIENRESLEVYLNRKLSPEEGVERKELLLKISTTKTKPKPRHSTPIQKKGVWGAYVLSDSNGGW